MTSAVRMRLSAEGKGATSLHGHAGVARPTTMANTEKWMNSHGSLISMATINAVSLSGEADSVPVARPLLVGSSGEELARRPSGSIDRSPIAYYYERYARRLPPAGCVIVDCSYRLGVTRLQRGKRLGTPLDRHQRATGTKYGNRVPSTFTNCRTEAHTRLARP